MSFPKAPVKRFNETTSNNPAPGTYDPSRKSKIPCAYINTGGQRFHEQDPDERGIGCDNMRRSVTGSMPNLINIATPISTPSKSIKGTPAKSDNDNFKIPSDMRPTHSGLEQKIRRMEKELEEKDRLYFKLQTECEDLSIKLKTSSEKVKKDQSIIKENEKLKAEIIELKKSLEACNVKYTDMEAQFKLSTKEFLNNVNVLKKTEETQNQLFEELTSKLKIKSKKEEMLITENESIKLEIINLKESLEISNSKYSDLETEFKDLRNESTKEIEILLDNIAVLKKTEDRQKEISEELTSKLDIISKKEEFLLTENESMKLEIINLKKSLEISNNKYIDLETEFKDLRNESTKEMEILLNNVAVLKKTEDTQKEISEELTSKLDIISKKEEFLLTENESMKLEIINLKESLEISNNKCIDLKTEFKDLRNESTKENEILLRNIELEKKNSEDLSTKLTNALESNKVYELTIKDNEGLKIELQELKKLVDISNNDNEILQAKFNTSSTNFQNEIEVLKNTINDQNVENKNKIDDLLNTINLLKKENKEIILERKNDKHDSEKQISYLKEEINQLNEEKLKEGDEFRSTIEDLKIINASNIDNWTMEKNDFEKCISTLEYEISEVKDEKVTEINNMELIINSLKGEHDTVVEKLQTKIHLLERETELLDAEKLVLNADLMECKEFLNEINSIKESISNVSKNYELLKSETFKELTIQNHVNVTNEKLISDIMKEKEFLLFEYESTASINSNLNEIIQSIKNERETLEMELNVKNDKISELNVKSEFLNDEIQKYTDSIEILKTVNSKLTESFEHVEKQNLELILKLDYITKEGIDKSKEIDSLKTDKQNILDSQIELKNQLEEQISINTEKYNELLKNQQEIFTEFTNCKLASENLQTENSKLTNSILELNNQNEDLSYSLIEKEKQIQKLEVSEQQLTTNLKVKVEKLYSLENEFEEMRLQKDLLLEENQSLKDEIVEITEVFKLNKTSLANLEQEKLLLEKDLEKRNNNIEDFKKILQQSAEQFEADNAQLEHYLKESKKEIVTLNGKFDELKQSTDDQIKDLKFELDENRKQLSDTSNKLDLEIQNSSMLSKDLESKIFAINSLNSEIVEKDSEIYELQQKNTSHHDTINELETNVSELNQKLCVKDRMKIELVSDVKNHLKNLLVLISSAIEPGIESIDDSASVDDHVKIVKSTVSKLVQFTNNMKECKSVMTIECDKVKEYVSQLQKEIALLIESEKATKQQLNDAIETSDFVKKSMEEYQYVLDGKKDIIENLEKELLSANLSNKNIADQYVNLTTEKRRLENYVLELEERLSDMDELKNNVVDENELDLLKNELEEEREKANRFKSLYEKLHSEIEPFEEQLKLMRDARLDALSDADKMSKAMADIVGHHNTKQRIHHVRNLLVERQELKNEILSLRERCSRLEHRNRNLENQGQPSLLSKKKLVGKENNQKS